MKLKEVTVYQTFKIKINTKKKKIKIKLRLIYKNTTNKRNNKNK
jgi:hypothetical protein